MSADTPHLIQNAVYIPEDDVYIKSEHVHDYVAHTFKDGKEIAVDGGLSYARRVGNIVELEQSNRYQEYCLVSDDKFEGFITDRLLWGSRGKNGDEKLTYRPIKEYALRPDGLEHMKAILVNCLNIAPLHAKVVKYWIEKLEGSKQ